MIENSQAIQAKSGPVYDEWHRRVLQAQYERAQRELRRMGELPDPSKPAA